MLRTFPTSLKKFNFECRPGTNLFRANNLTLTVLETIYKLRRNNTRVWNKVKAGNLVVQRAFSNYSRRVYMTKRPVLQLYHTSIL